MGICTLELERCTVLVGTWSLPREKSQTLLKWLELGYFVIENLLFRLYSGHCTVQCTLLSSPPGRPRLTLIVCAMHVWWAEWSQEIKIIMRLYQVCRCLFAIFTLVLDPLATYLQSDSPYIQEHPYLMWRARCFMRVFKPCASTRSSFPMPGMVAHVDLYPLFHSHTHTHTH